MVDVVASGSKSASIACRLLDPIGCCLVRATAGGRADPEAAWIAAGSSLLDRLEHLILIFIFDEVVVTDPLLGAGMLVDVAAPDGRDAGRVE